MRCLGRYANLKRCKRKTRWLVCDHHFFQLIASIITIITVISVIGNIYQDIWNPFINKDNTAKNRLLGILESANTTTEDIVQGLKIRLDSEVYIGKAQDNGSNASLPMAPIIPQTLDALTNDGELYPLLSEPFRESLPQFVKTHDTYIEGYEMGLKLTKHAQPGTIWLMLNEYITQQQCIELEIMYQKGILSKYEHQSLFRIALGQQVERMMEHATISNESISEALI